MCVQTACRARLLAMKTLQFLVLQLCAVTILQGQQVSSIAPCQDAGYTSCCDTSLNNCLIPGFNCYCDFSCYIFRDCCNDITEIGCSPPTLSEVILGFEQNYNVSESNRSVEVCVRVFNPPDNQPLPNEVVLVVDSIDETAQGGDDFQPIQSSLLDVYLLLNESQRRACFNIEIFADTVCEETETFFLQLNFDKFLPNATRSQTTIEPALTTITIQGPIYNVTCHRESRDCSDAFNSTSQTENAPSCCASGGMSFIFSTGQCFPCFSCNSQSGCSDYGTDLFSESISTPEECCLNSPGLSYRIENCACTECVVYGFLQNNLTESERGQFHPVHIGYRKVPNNFLWLFISGRVSVAPGGTAVNGRDFLLSSTTFFIGPGRDETIFVTFLVDNIAQEFDETAQLQLNTTTSPIPTGLGIFFRDTLDLIIRDSDMAVIGFNAIEYVANENGQSESVCQVNQSSGLQVTVRKTIATANPISVRIQPLTIEQALALNLNIPMLQNVNITSITPRIPIRARTEPIDVRDFSPDYINITFPADELTFDRIKQIPVNIELFDDDIDEADREYFILHLTLLDAVSLDGLLDHHISIGVIEDNDVICEKLEHLVNGHIEYSPDTTAPYDEGTRATHICNRGFVLVGNKIRLCQNDSDFDGAVPTCEPGLVHVGLTAPFLTVREIDRQFKMCVQLQSEATIDITITMAAEDGSAIDRQDYNSSSIPNELIIHAGSTQQCFIGVVINDGIREDRRESFIIRIISVTPDVVNTSRETIEVVIIDTDVAWIVAQDHMILEANTTVDLGFKIIRGDRSVRTRAFAYTEGGSATQGFDYLHAGVKCGKGDSNLRWSTNSSLPDTTFTVTIISNPEPEPVKTIEVRVECEEMENCYSQRPMYSITIIDPQGQCSNLIVPVNGQVSYDFLPYPMRPYGTVAIYTCDSGYELSISSKNNTRECVSGSWSGNASICEPVDCGPLNSPANGQVTQNATVFESTANYSCSSGFGLLGNATRVCQANGSWSDPPSCEVDCGPPFVQNGQVSVTGTLLKSMANYTCNDNYSIVGNVTRVCQDDGNWSGSTTCQIDCGPLYDPHNGEVSMTGTVLASIANYNCNYGYGIVGDTSRVCLPEGTWSGSAATCQITCELPPPPENGEVAVTGTLLGFITNYTCNNDYTVVGNTTRVCQSNRTWSGTAIICEANCVNLTDPENGQVTLSGVTPGSTANYSCSVQHSIAGISTRVCQNGTWSGNSPSCSQNMCEVLSSPKNGQVFDHPTIPGSFAVYDCDSGYNTVGDGRIECLNNGTWSTTPVCTRTNCVSLRLELPNGYVELINGTVFESVANYSCNPQYSIVGNSSRVCQADGTWSNNEPRCDLDNTIIGTVTAVAVTLLLLVLIVIVVFILHCLSKRRRLPTIGEDSSIFIKTKTSFRRRSQKQSGFQQKTQGMVEQIPQSLRIPRSHLKMSTTTLGQGEFGIVYKGLLTNWNGVLLQGVAVKALKGLFSLGDVQSMVNEIIKMQEFKHPHILSLIGVCLDTGPGISMVMPYMVNGSLLDYLRKERSNLEIQDNDSVKTLTARRLLLRMCHQIALGMKYLTEQKFIHRDLAARNCMLDSDGNVKVGDFGLAEEVYNCGYFREKENVRLPYKWMAMESLNDSIFSKKTDVWSYGVTMWEVFSGGRNPYPAVDPMSLAQLLRDGKRLEPPENAACSIEISTVMARCWCEDPEERPHFSELCSIMDQLLTQMSDYIELKMVLVEDNLDVHEYDIAEDEPLNETSV